MTNQNRNVVTAVFVAATLGILGSYLTRTVDPVDPLHAYIQSIPDAGLDAGALCSFRAGLAQPSLVNVWLPALDAGSARYGIAKVCAPIYDADAGADAGDALITAGSFYVLPDMTFSRVDVWDGGPQVEVWLQGSPSAPFPCACATDAGGCLLSDAGPAPRGTTLAPGWSGTCLPKTCVELSGTGSMPTECL